MKCKFLSLSIFILSITLAPSASWANEVILAQIQDLKIEMQNMRQDYEMRISTLQGEVNELKQNRTQGFTPLENSSKPQDKKGITIDYVGRKEGPFQKGGLVASDSSGFGQVSLGGYADIELENFQNKNSTFDQHRLVLNVGAELGERLRFYSEFELEHGGPDAAGGGEAKVEQAHMDFLIHEAVNVRAGALLVPFGRYNLYHDSDLQDLTDRPLLTRDVIPTTWTESGAGLFGEVYPSIPGFENLKVGYELYMVNGLSSSFSDTGLRGARGSLGSDNNNNKAVVGRMLFSPAIGQEIGVSGYIGDASGHDDDIKGIGIDFLSTWGPLEVLGEWAYFNAEENLANTLGGAGDVANYFTGAYLQANYHFWFDFLDNTFLGKTFENPTFTFINRFGWVRIDDDSDGGTFLGNDNNNEEWRYTLGINYRPVESWALKLEYQNNHTKFETLERGNDEGFVASIAMGF